MRTGNTQPLVAPFYTGLSTVMDRNRLYLTFLIGRKPIVSKLEIDYFTAACTGGSMRKHYVGTYAHKKIARFRVGIYKSCSSYKTERAIDLKLSPTNQERCVERENSKNNFQTKCLVFAYTVTLFFSFYIIA